MAAPSTKLQLLTPIHEINMVTRCDIVIVTVISDVTRGRTEVMVVIVYLTLRRQ